MKTSKTVLFFSYWYPHQGSPAFASFIKRHAQSIALNNTEKVLAISIINGRKLYRYDVQRYTDEQGLETHHIFLTSRFHKLLYLLLPLHYWILKRYIRRNIFPAFPFDILHSNVLFPCAVVGHWLSDSFKTRHVISEHWSKLDKFFKVSLYRRAGRSALNHAAAITCVSETLRNTLQQYTHNTSIYIVPNVVNARQFYRDLRVPANEVLTFIAVAHWEPPKNPFLFLDALRELRQEGKLGSLKMIFVGTGRQLEEIKHSGYPFDIEFKGNLMPAELNTEFNKSHIFLHGSDFETFSVVIVEALLSGTPVVASPVGIAPEVIRPSNGCIAPNSIREWKEGILKACHTTYDRQTIAKALDNRYSPKTVGHAFSHLYEQLL